MSKYRILSIDGGGIRGLITAIILQRIIKTPGLENLLELVDLITGTSTGGLLALAIAKRMDIAEIREVYEERSRNIFDDSWLDDLVDMGKLLGADYNITGLQKELQRLFGNTTLGDLEKRVLITSFNLDNEKEPGKRTWNPKLFHNFDGAGNDKDCLVRDVGVYTSAAPTFFPSVEGYIDGGVFASNPSMCGLAQTQDPRYEPNPVLDDVLLLSIGTGTSLQYIEGKSHWGYAQWAKPLVNLMLDGANGIADYQCKQILRERYHRLAPVFPAGMRISMDDIKKIPTMIDFAENVQIGDTVNWLNRVWIPENEAAQDVYE